MVLLALSSTASEQANATEMAKKNVLQLLDYLPTKPEAKVCYYASGIVLNIYADASYLGESRAHSHVAGQYVLGKIPKKDQPIVMNGAIYIFCGIPKFVVSSVAEAELGALFLNCKEGKIIHLILEESGYEQPPTPIHCGNVRHCQ